MVGDLAAEDEAAGWEGFFVWDHLQYGDRVTEIADVWTCCAAVAMRRPQVLARQVGPAPSRERPRGGRMAGTRGTP